MVTAQAQLQSEMIQYHSQDGTQINAYMSRPTAPGRYPGVIVTMEGMGLMEHMKDVARRFAAEGYIALAPDLYTREGAPDPNNIDEVVKVLFSSPDSQVVADMEGAATYLKNQPNCNDKVGAIGFCSGGRYTLIFACKSTNLDAAIDSAGGFIHHRGRADSRASGIAHRHDIHPVLPPAGPLRRGRPKPFSRPRCTSEGGAGQARQDVRVPDVSQRWTCLLC